MCSGSRACARASVSQALCVGQHPGKDHMCCPCLQLLQTPAYVFLAPVIKRSSIRSVFTSCVGSCGFDLLWAARKEHVGVHPALSGEGEEMYMDGAPCFLERKITVRLGFGGGRR